MVAGYATRELRTDGSDANERNVVALTRPMEARLGVGLRLDQRAKVAKCVSIMQRLEFKWNFDWAVSSTRRAGSFGGRRQSTTICTTESSRGRSWGTFRGGATASRPQP